MVTDAVNRCRLPRLGSVPYLHVDFCRAWCYLPWYYFAMSKIRRGGYVFITWIGDHPPRHVHVFRNGRLVLKWNLENALPMEGQPSSALLELIRELQEDGRL
jgi:hypothetical protein